mmetsp:Transcript_100413/g.284271  ORF Transcript_100413/g.284271 Transcript_100413/m.284271 type:complete len:164 (-) Transcript_100413:112-603(-)
MRVRSSPFPGAGPPPPGPGLGAPPPAVAQASNVDDSFFEEWGQEAAPAQDNRVRPPQPMGVQPPGPLGGSHFAQPPQPQGPIAIVNGKQGTVEFRNPFDVAVEFSVKVDNPCFTVPQKVVKVDTQKSTSITVTFKSDKSQNGRLVISCEAGSTPWVFFLKGSV